MRELSDNYGIEQFRLQYLTDRDGIEATLAFAIQTMKIYRRMFFAKDRQGRKFYCHDKVYRRGFLESVVAFKRFIAANSVDFYTKHCTIASSVKQGTESMKIGGNYNWKGQSERLVYLGRNWSGNGFWHQFAKVESPSKVWCEITDSDLDAIEETEQL